MYAVYWLIASAVFLLVEIMTLGLTSIWFAGGAVVAAITALFGVPFWVQMLIFIVVTCLLFALTRPVAKRYLNSKVQKTNTDALIGQTALVKETINNMESKGLVQLNGQDWTARSFEAGEIIPEGSEVIVKEIRGVKLIVERESIILFIIVIALLAMIISSTVRIVPQAHAYVVERLGAYQGTWSVGLHVKVPFIDRVARKVNLKEQVVDFPPQPVITKDNVTMQIDTVVYFQITDPKLYSYGVENPIMAIENLTATTLRNVIGDLELDETLTSRETINTQMRATLDVATDPWGIKVNRVELKNIIPPAAIQDAMEKQMKAERERREAILIAEGEKKSAILRAEGQKESMVLQAEGDKEAAILRAKKEATIREAEGQAEAIRAIQKANAQGIESIKAAKADDAVIQLKSLEAFAKAADGKATKIIIPSEIQGMAGLVKSITEVAEDDEKNIADLIEEQVQDTVKEQ